MASTPLSAAAVEELANEVMGEVAESLEQFAPATAVLDAAANPEVPITSGFIPEPGTPRTTWSRGEGLDGSFYEPDSLDGLIDFIGDIEFKASVDSEDYIRWSNLDGRAYFYDENSNNFGQSHIHAHAYREEGNASDFSDINANDGTTEIEFRENLKDRWGTREFINRLVDVAYLASKRILLVRHLSSHQQISEPKA